MTIPVVPGPFAFLDTIGQGVGSYLGNKVKKEQQDFEDNIKRFQTVYQGVKDGILPRTTLSSPETTGLLAQIMEHPEMQKLNTVPSVSEATDTARAPLIPGMVQGLDQTGQQLFAKSGELPTASDVQTEKNTGLAAGIKGKALGQPLTDAQQSTVSGVPTAQTAQAGEQGKQDPALEAIVDRHVQELYTKLGRLPTPKEAFEHGFGDPSATAFQGRLNESFYGQAIEKQRRVLVDEATKRLAAANKDGNQDRWLRDLNAQQNTLNNSMRARDADNAKLSSQLTVGAKYGAPTERDKQLMSQIEANSAANQKDQQTFDNLTLQAGTRLGTNEAPTVAAPTKPGGAPRPPAVNVKPTATQIKSLQTQYDAALKYLKEKKATPEEIKKLGERPK